MKNYLLLGLIVSGLCIIVLTSCFNLKKHFDIYKRPIIDEEKEIPIKINGIYAPRVNDKQSSFFFFKNGAAKWSGWTNDFWENKLKEMENIRTFEKNFPKDYWGHFAIHDDTITIQFFNHNNEEFYKRWIHEFKGIIKNDSSILMLTWYSYWDKSYLFKEPIEYYYYPTTIKPDSTKAWFNNRRWYKKNLHESRR